jgi:ADP-glucose pyrophosphorylase
VTRAVPHAGPVGTPVRTRAEYVQALRQYHRTRQGVAAVTAGPMAEDWKPAFGIVERGAAAHPSAQVLDSVVLAGARVERDAVLVRSVVCPGAVVRRGRVVVDQLVRASR